MLLQPLQYWLAGGIVFQDSRHQTLGSWVQAPPRAFKGFAILAIFLCDCDYKFECASRDLQVVFVCDLKTIYEFNIRK